MLRTRTVRHVLLASVALVAGLLGWTAPATAAPVTPADMQPRDQCVILVEVVPGVFDYFNYCENPGDDGGGEDDGGGGGGGGGGPRCDLSHEPYTEFCLTDDMPCRADIPSTVPLDRWPMDQRPSPNHIYTFVECDDPDVEEPFSDHMWIRPYRDALPDLGWAAYGQLQTPAFTLGFTPADMTYVGAETRFTLDGLGDGQIIGAQAGPLLATGTLSHVEIDPGDGTGVIECDPDLRSTACEHVYLTMSHEQTTLDLRGRPAFPAQARLVYDVTFTVDGVEQSPPGVPATLESPWNGTLVPVGEIQALVRTS